MIPSKQVVPYHVFSSRFGSFSQSSTFLFYFSIQINRRSIALWSALPKRSLRYTISALDERVRMSVRINDRSLRESVGYWISQWQWDVRVLECRLNVSHTSVVTSDRDELGRRSVFCPVRLSWCVFGVVQVMQEMDEVRVLFGHSHRSHIVMCLVDLQV